MFEMGAFLPFGEIYAAAQVFIASAAAEFS